MSISEDIPRQVPVIFSISIAGRDPRRDNDLLFPVLGASPGGICRLDHTAEKLPWHFPFTSGANRSGVERLANGPVIHLDEAGGWRGCVEGVVLAECLELEIILCDDR